MAGGRPKHPDVLTPAEWRVLDGIRQGRTNGEIADDLGLSLNTVKYHVSNMLGKLELSSREELASWTDGRRRRWLLAPRVALVAATTAVVAGAGIVIATALLHGGSGAARAGGDPSGRIAFISGKSDQTGTVLQYVDVESRSEATPPQPDYDYVQFSPQWSPDGLEIAYVQMHASDAVEPGKSSVSQLVVTNTDGSSAGSLADNVSLLPAPGVVEGPHWRADGSLLLFTTQDFIASIVAPDGSQRQDEALGCETSAWAREGGISLCSVFDGESTSPTVRTSLDIWPALNTGFRAAETRVPSRNNNPTTATTSIQLPGIQVQPVLSDDGAWLAWWGYVAGAAPHVYAAPVQADRQVVEDKMRDLGPGQVPEFASGSHRLVFSTTTDLSFPPKLAAANIVVADLDSGKTKELTKGGSNRWPSWSPDGAFVTFVSDRDEPHGEVYAVRADGSEWWRLTNNATAEYMPAWAPR